MNTTVKGITQQKRGGKQPKQLSCAPNTSKTIEKRGQPKQLNYEPNTSKTIDKKILVTKKTNSPKKNIYEGKTLRKKLNLDNNEKSPDKGITLKSKSRTPF